MKRGDIYWISNENADGDMIQKNRPAVLVSNDALNETSGVVEVVYLTLSPKKDMPTHCTIMQNNRLSTALCEQITTVNKTQLNKWCGMVTDQEMKMIDECIMRSLGLNYESKTVDKNAEKENKRMKYTLNEVCRERDMYMDLYKEMLNEMLDN